MAVAAILDFLTAVILTAIVTAPTYGTEAFQSSVIAAIMLFLKFGIGASLPLIFIAPVMLLFSYNRKPRFPSLDRFIPIAGVALIILVYFECVYTAIRIGVQMKGIGI